MNEDDPAVSGGVVTCGGLVEMGESRTPRPEPAAEDHYERVRCFVVDPGVPTSAPWPRIQSRPLAGLLPGYVTLTRSASSLDDASTAREDEAASTLTLRP